MIKFSVIHGVLNLGLGPGVYSDLILDLEWSYKQNSGFVNDKFRAFPLHLSKEENDKLLKKIFNENYYRLSEGDLITRIGSSIIQAYKISGRERWDTPKFLFHCSLYLGVTKNNYSLDPSELGDLGIGLILKPEYSLKRDNRSNELSLRGSNARSRFYSELSTLINLEEEVGKIEGARATTNNFVLKMRL